MIKFPLIKEINPLSTKPLSKNEDFHWYKELEDNGTTFQLNNDNHTNDKTHPLERASWFSEITYSWLNSLISYGFKNIIQEKDVWLLCKQDQSNVLWKRFYPYWEKEIKKINTTNSNNNLFLSALYHCFYYQIIQVICHLFINTICVICQPFFIKEILTNLQYTSTNNDMKLYLLSTGLIIISIGSVITMNSGLYYACRIGLNARTLLMDVVYRKSMYLSNKSNDFINHSGETITLVSVDAERMFDMALLGMFVFFSPLTMGISILFIGIELGFISFISSFVCTVFVLIIVIYITKDISITRSLLLKKSEERMNLLSEILQGIRIIKYYGWEKYINNKIKKIRMMELNYLSRFHYTRLFNNIFLSILPYIIGLICFGLYVGIQNNILSVSKAFTVLAFINILKVPAIILPNSLAYFSEGLVALKRTNLFLKNKEIQLNIYNSHTSLYIDKKYSIIIKNANFQYLNPSIDNNNSNNNSNHNNSTFPIQVVGQNENDNEHLNENINENQNSKKNSFLLKDIDLNIINGSLVMIIGKVGSGKTSLIQAILGEMNQILNLNDNNINNNETICIINGTIAYASQEPWIQNATLRNNILFNDLMFHDIYDKILSICQLKPDLNLFNAKDMIEIGERGINLSGGQKARINIARAMYKILLSKYNNNNNNNNNNILILDDPLSALDIHVANAIFNECILNLKLNLTRIIALNSHYHLLKYADHIIIMDNGKIIKQGTYDILKNDFPSIFIDYNNINTTNNIEKMNSLNIEKNQKILSPNTISLDFLMSPINKELSVSNDHENKKKGILINEEDRKIGSVGITTYIKYFEMSGGNGIFILFMILLSFIFGQMGQSITDWWIGIWSEKMTSVKLTTNKYNINNYIFIFICLSLFTTILITIRSIIYIIISIYCSKKLHEKIMKRLLKAPITTFFDVIPIGRILNRFSRDMDMIDSSLPFFFIQSLQYTLQVIAVFVICGFSSPYSMISYIPIVIGFIILQNYFQKTSNELKRLDGITRSPILNLVGETCNGLTTIRSYKYENLFIKKNRENIDNNTRFVFNFWMAGRWLSLRLDLLSIVLLSLITFVSVYLREKVDLKLVGLALVYGVQLTNFLQRMVRTNNMTENNMTSVERLFYYMDIEIEEDENKLINNYIIPDITWPLKGNIQFDNLSIRYRTGLDFVLKNISCQIYSGEKIGICGRTGSGKSSLIAALFRIVQFEKGYGTIIIDGIDISKIPLNVLRSKIAIIPQDPVLFSGTIRENLDPNDQFTDTEIWSILRQIHMKDYINESNQGLLFKISEKGNNLSLGQRQLLCIGRALLRKYQIVILDEATANVDLSTDKLIQETVRKTLVNQTLLCIAHRLETIIDSDKIMVLQDGLLKEFESPTNLLNNKDSMFRSLVEKAGLIVENAK